MMAESDLITKEDIDEIGGVLQLAPHQKNTTFTTVTKSEEGDLVSLDELYEKTGQEAISKFIDGFEMLVKNNKLGREHGMALNIQGAENWMQVPDRFNAIKGGEGFFGAIRNGIVAIVKAIIAFITGICNWIASRFKALLGWGPTAKETEALHDVSSDVKSATKDMLTKFGVAVDDDFFDSIPNGITLTETFSITKKRIEDNKEAFERLAVASEYLKGYRDQFNTWTSGIRMAKRDYDRAMSVLRNKVRNGRITSADVNDYNDSLLEIHLKYSDTRKIYAYLDGLVKSLYGIELQGLGSTENFKELKEQVETITEQVKVSYNPNYGDALRQSAAQTYKNMFGDKANTPLKPGLVKELKNIVNLKDSEFIQGLEKEYPEYQLSAGYLRFSQDISLVAGLLEFLLKLIQKVEISVNNMIRWKDKVDCLLSAYIVNDFATIIAAHQKYLTPAQRSTLEKTFKSKSLFTDKDGKEVEVELQVPLYTDQIQDIFFKKAEGDTTLEKFSEGMSIFMASPQGKVLMDNYQRFKSQLKG